MRYLLAFLMASSVLIAAPEETCRVRGEKVDGLNKICYYDCPSGEAAITVKNYQLCPLSIKR